MPALLPTCAVLYEEGANFIAGELQNKMLEVSPDGFIR